MLGDVETGADDSVLLGGTESVVDGGAESTVDGGALDSLVGVDGGVCSTLVEAGVSGSSCASAPVVAPPNARTAAVVKAPILSRARLTDLPDKIPP
ncbi:hypothetical protein SAMN05216188_10112 [Lentzea xinjiangensis]|uniref:Uncharacterized protein n=1 Tax=Lentzea xinjiangensis TaxID=402600 RepID=A0A1H8ZF84_9PSEU|nr:hypothetical protein SAMN05216188_10112 [Lentzea xinjiangensis]